MSQQPSSSSSQQKSGAESGGTRRMGKYELGKVLGTGSFSKVRECIDTTTKEIYAVKIIDKTQLAKEHLEEQLKREISILKQLRHRFVVSMKEVLQTTRHIYIVLELITGGELFDKIVQNERLPEDLARKYFQQLIVAVRHCHKHGIAHRDLKPENLLLDKEGNIKVSDFGLANLQYREGEMMRTVVGTPNYVAPEVIRQTNSGQGYNGLMADVWSCGIILYVMLSGHQAFDDKSLKALFNKIERGQYSMSRYFTEGARNLIHRILIVDPTKRYTINDILNDPWFRVNFDTSLLDIGTNAASADPNTAVETLNDGLLSPQAANLGDGDASSPNKAGKPSGGNSGVSGAEDGFALALRLMLMQSPANLPKQRAIPGPNVSPAANQPLNVNPSADKSARAFLFRGSTASCVAAVYDSLASFVPAFQKPAQPSTEIRGHAVFKGTGKGAVLTYLIEVRPIAGQQYCMVELKYGIGEKSDFALFFQTLVSKIDQTRMACPLVNPPWVASENLVTKRK